MEFIMKKLMLIVVSVFILTFSAQAQQKLSMISFTVSNLSDDDAEVLLSIFTSEISKYNNYFTLLSRSENDFRAAFEELKFQRNMTLDEDQLSAIGEYLGANWVCYGRALAFGNTASVTINILDVETAKVIGSSSAVIPSLYEITSYSENMIKELLTKAIGLSFVLPANFNMNARVNSHYTGLITAAREGDLAAVKSWIAAGADLDVKDANYTSSRTALHHASEKGLCGNCKSINRVWCGC